jgi:NAD-dependent SIR2 family protein deacetylase
LKALGAFESVRCLECSEIYSKPAGGSTAQKNPGCPECGYVGWIPVSLPGEAPAPRRSVGDPRQPHDAQQR